MKSQKNNLSWFNPRNYLIKKSQNVSKSQHKENVVTLRQTIALFTTSFNPLVESTCEKVSHFIAMTLSNSISSFLCILYFTPKLISVCLSHMLNMIEKLNDEETPKVDFELFSEHFNRLKLYFFINLFRKHVERDFSIESFENSIKLHRFNRRMKNSFNCA